MNSMTWVDFAWDVLTLALAGAVFVLVMVLGWGWIALTKTLKAEGKANGR